MTFGPSSVFAGKKEVGKRETISRTNSSQNMFSMLSQNAEAAGEGSNPKSSHSRKTSIDISHSGVTEPPPQRKRLILQPRTKPATEETAPVLESESSSEDEVTDRMSESEASKKIDEDSKEFFGVRSLEEAEVYFTNLPAEHHFRLVEKLVSSAVESKESDAQLVSDFFNRAAAKGLCSPTVFEEGFMPVAELLDDIAIDAPKAFNFMAIMMVGAGLDKDEERRMRIASKSDVDRLVALLS
jgi:translation initiation factor 4G